jgi:hypothetical protein
MISKETILISCNGHLLGQVTALFIAPVGVEKQQGLIQMWSVAKGHQGKHILHTLAQRALFEFEEMTLIPNWQPVDTIMTFTYGKMETSLVNGLALMMDKENLIKLFVHKGVEIIPMLRIIYRHATRMIRLDVR